MMMYRPKRTTHREVSGLVFNLQALRVGQGVLGVFLVCLGAITFEGAGFTRDSLPFSLFAVVIGTLLLIYTVVLWKRKKSRIACGFYINTFAWALGALEMAYNGTMVGSGKQGASGTFLLSFLVMIVSAGFARSFNILRKASVA